MRFLAPCGHRDQFASANREARAPTARTSLVCAHGGQNDALAADLVNIAGAGPRAHCDKARLLFIPECCVKAFDRRENGGHGGQHRVHSAVGDVDLCDRVGWDVAWTSGPQNLCLLSSIVAQPL
jgi:hypothetical protein